MSDDPSAEPSASKSKSKKLPPKNERFHIPDTPENVAKAIMKKPPKKEWRFMNKDK